MRASVHEVLQAHARLVRLGALNRDRYGVMLELHDEVTNG